MGSSKAYLKSFKTFHWLSWALDWALSKATRKNYLIFPLYKIRELHSNMLIVGIMVIVYISLVYSPRTANSKAGKCFNGCSFLCKHLFLKTSIRCVRSWAGSCVMSLMATIALLFHCLALCVVIYTCVSGCKMLPLCICSIFIFSLQFLSLLPTYFCKSSILC